MTQLGPYVRQNRTQTVWMTAALPPAFEEAFLRRNLLIRPRMIRESTNCASIRYSVVRYRGAGGPYERVSDLVRTILAGGNSIDGDDARDQADDQATMVVSSPTLDLLRELLEELGYPKYIGDRDMMCEEEKQSAID